MVTNQVIVGTAILGLSLWFFWLRPRIRNSHPLPPGPSGDPIIGHIRHVPAIGAEKTFMQWGKECNSEILYLNVLGPKIVLNSVRVATELLERRGAKYSERPLFAFFEEQGWKNHASFMCTGTRFATRRRMFANTLSRGHCVPYRAIQTREARRLALRIIDNPEEWEHHVTQFVATLTLGITCGIAITSDDDPYIDLAKNAQYVLDNAGSIGITAIDIFPVLRNMPHCFKLIPSLNFARECYPQVRALVEVPFAFVKEQMKNGAENPCFVSNLLKEIDQEHCEENFYLKDITEKDIKASAGEMFVAGSDTTSSVLGVFMLNMVLHPEVQGKAWAEIDSVVGRDRLPTFVDKDKLHYVEHIVQETFRWNPVVPLGVPHKSAEDDILNGMFIPKAQVLTFSRSTIFANAYAMTHDEAIYTNPDDFNPDRYAKHPDGKLGEPFPVGHFGFGRRICPGQHLAYASVWITIATMLATLDISKAVDVNGEEITPAPAMTSGLSSRPEPFPSLIKARYPEVVEVLSKD